MIFSQRSNLLNQAAKIVDDEVVEVEILEQWQRFNVYGMSLERYLRPRKLKLLTRQVESPTNILLKIMPYWLINKDCLKKQQDKGNKQRSATVITVNNKIEAK